MAGRARPAHWLICRALRRGIQCRDQTRRMDLSRDRQTRARARAGFPEDARRRPRGPCQWPGSGLELAHSVRQSPDRDRQGVAIRRTLAIAAPSKGGVTLKVQGRVNSPKHSGVLEGRVDLDAVLGGVQLRPPASTVLDAGGQVRDFPRENLVVEGKGFEPSTSALRTPRSPN